MSKFTIHNGIESDTLNSPVNFTTGIQINGSTLTNGLTAETLPADVVTTAAGVAASGDLDGADTVDEAALEAALLAQETELGLLKDDVEALAAAHNALLVLLTTVGVLE